MEIFGNPISGYTTEYYTKIIEEQNSFNKTYLNNLDKYCNSFKKEIKYERNNK
jgi:hypothetical protein